MILGRPTNLWLGIVTSGLGFLQIAIVTLIPTADPVSVATVLGALGLFLGAVISLVANQPPTVNEGSAINVVTPPGQDNVPISATVPPLEPNP